MEFGLLQRSARKFMSVRVCSPVTTLCRMPISVWKILKLVRICEHELDQTDMATNVKNRAPCASAHEMIFRLMLFEPLMELLFRGLTN